MAKSQGPTDSNLPTEGFAFRGDMLRAGDVLLCTNPDDLISRAIRFATGGTFSHAAICTVPPLFIEANDHGVAEISLDRLNLVNPSAARILRLNSHIINSDAIARNAAEAALRYGTREYGTIPALSSIVAGWTTDPEARPFCSYLVAAAYEVAGLNITHGKKKPAKTTPADIEKSPFFDNITPWVLMRASFDYTYGPVYFLDRNNEQTPGQKYNIMLREVGQRISAYLVGKHQPPVATYPEAQSVIAFYKDMPWFREFDAYFAELVRTLALPVVVEAAPIIKQGRQGYEKSITDILRRDALDQPSFDLLTHFIVHRFATTREMIAHRDKDIEAYATITVVHGVATYLAWLECEQEINGQLRKNLVSLKRLWPRLCQYAEKHEWTMAGTVDLDARGDHLDPLDDEDAT